MDANSQWCNSADKWFRCQVCDKSHHEFFDTCSSLFMPDFHRLVCGLSFQFGTFLLPSEVDLGRKIFFGAGTGAEKHKLSR